MKISQLYIYPIKSLPPLAVSSAKISTHGFEYDRQFMLIRLKTDGSTQNMTIKETSELCLFKLELTPSGDSITVKSLPPLHLSSPAAQGSSSSPASPSSSEKFTFTHLPNETITIPLTPSRTHFKSAKTYQITIYESTAKAWDMGDTYASFFTRCLTNNSATSGDDDGEIRLIYTGPDEGRFTDDILTPSSRREPSKSSSINPMMQIPWLKKSSNNSNSASTTKGQKIAFSDAAPMLVVTTKSLEDVRSRLPEREREGIDMVLFRPNLVVENRAEGGVRGKAYDEEFWAGVEIFNDQLQGEDKEQEGGQKRVWLEMTFNTVRCQSINIDLQTGRQKPSDQQIYKKLMKDRRINPYFKYKPCFGKYALCNQYGAIVSIGDEVVVVKRNEERHVPVV